MQLTEETGMQILEELRIVKSMIARESDIIKKLLWKDLYKEQWVKVSTIVRMTGWNHHRMYRARKRGEIVFKKDKKGGFWYDANSVHEVYIVKTKA